jgi:hypothetical protein
MSTLLDVSTVVYVSTIVDVSTVVDVFTAIDMSSLVISLVLCKACNKLNKFFALFMVSLEIIFALAKGFLLLVGRHAVQIIVICVCVVCVVRVV